MPSITLKPIGDTFIAENYPSTSYGSSPIFLLIGQYSGSTDNYRIILKFNVDKIPFNYSINSAKLSFFIDRNDVPSLSKTLSFYKIITSFDMNTVNFNTRPSIAYNADASINLTNELNTIITVDITNMVNDWHTGSSENNGLMIIGNETTSSLLTFIGTGYANSSFWPTLTIESDIGSLILYPSELVTATDIKNGSTAILLGTNTATFGIINSGPNNCYVFPEISPDGLVWINDLSPIITTPLLKPQESITLTTRGHMRYARIAFQSENSNQPTQLTIYPSTVSLG